jgi:hypothetical protein
MIRSDSLRYQSWQLTETAQVFMLVRTTEMFDTGSRTLLGLCAGSLSVPLSQ